MPDKKYTLYVDESGDHSLERIDENYPIFVISGCIFENGYYENKGDPLIKNFKQKYWADDSTILTSSTIRKCEGDFNFLLDSNKRKQFHLDLDELITTLDFLVISAVIFKIPHFHKYNNHAKNPYNLSLDFIMERFKFFLNNHSKGAIIAESRGKKENQMLQDEFISCKLNGTSCQDNFEMIEYIRFEGKNKNINGLQIADLSAYPIGVNYLYPCRVNPAFEIFKPKIRKSKDGSIEGYGVVVFPKYDYQDYQIYEF